MKKIKTKKKVRFRKAPTHSNQQLDALREHFVPNYSATIKSSNLKFFLHYYMIFARSAFKDIWHFGYTFSNICKNFPDLGVRNALWSVESSIQD